MSVIRFRHTHYTPEDDVKSILDALPTTAQRSIDVEIYGLTDLMLIGNIITAANRGVKVRVMNDHTQSTGRSDKHALQMLVDAGAVNGNIEVRVGESIHGAIDHLKNLIIDGVDGADADTSIVFYGSYNFSDSAQQENNLAVYCNDPGEVRQAMDKFTRSWETNKQLPAWQIAPSHPPVVTPSAIAPAEARATVLQAAVPQIAEEGVSS